MVQLTEQIIKGKTKLDKLEEVKNLNLWGQDLDDCAVLAKVRLAIMIQAWEGVSAGTCVMGDRKAWGWEAVAVPG